MDNVIGNYLAYCEKLNRADKNGHNPVPEVRQVALIMIQRNYAQIRLEIEDLANAEIERIMGILLSGTILKNSRL